MESQAENIINLPGETSQCNEYKHSLFKLVSCDDCDPAALKENRLFLLVGVNNEFPPTAPSRPRQVDNSAEELMT